MKIYGINGGPRKKWNTAKMLEQFLEGAKSADKRFETELIHLFDYSFAGCMSCYNCKRDDDARYGRCNIKDEISEVITQVSYADGVIFGSPIFFYNMTGQLRCFLERLLFPYHSFKKGEGSLAPKQVQTALVYTMNVTEARMRMSGYDRNLAGIERTIGEIFSSTPEILYAFNTYEFDDYKKYRADYWNELEKAEWHRTQFPVDLKNAFEAGKRMVEKIQAFLLSSDRIKQPSQQ